jgi:hypothetical protein
MDFALSEAQLQAEIELEHRKAEMAHEADKAKIAAAKPVASDRPGGSIAK